MSKRLSIEQRFVRQVNRDIRRTAKKVDPVLARHLWSVAKRAIDLDVDYKKLITMFDLALDAALDMRHLPAQVACCDVCED